MRTTTPTPLILVDVDDTIADFSGTVLTRLAETLPASHIPPLATITTFELELSFPAEVRPTIRSTFRAPGFCRDLPPLPGAVDALHALVDAGADVRLLTAPLSVASCPSDKWQWVERHLGADFTRRLILAKDKTLVRGDLLVDDKPHISGSLTPAWTHVRFTQPWNAGIPGPRLDRWSDWRSLLAERSMHP